MKLPCFSCRVETESQVKKINNYYNVSWATGNFLNEVHCIFDDLKTRKNVLNKLHNLVF